jgi:hypothetical protein
MTATFKVSVDSASIVEVAAEQVNLKENVVGTDNARGARRVVFTPVTAA